MMNNSNDESIYSGFEAVIGLEVHSQLLTKTKMFCSCPNIFGREPNSSVCPVCLALPGALPVINFEAVKLAVKAAAALNIGINKKSLFARKNYFYPDLPKGYQISQYLDPISSAGFLKISTENVEKKIRINRLHMEEDAGKLIHIGDKSFVDLNRAGTPLVEIVSEPDLSSAKEAVAYLKELRDILVYLDVSDGNMEEGSFRCDANISVRKKGDPNLGTRAEIKNVNSFKFVEKAIDYEIERQIELILSGGKVIQETRLYDSKENITRSMRGKEEAHDYRYFEEPDLPPVVLESGFIEEIKNSIIELPAAKRNRYISELELTAYDAEVLTQDKNIAFYFEDLVEKNNGMLSVKSIANWVINSLGENIFEQVSPDDFLEIIKKVESGEINRNGGKLILNTIFLNVKNNRYQTVAEIITESHLEQVSDEKGIEDMVRQVLDDNPKELEAFLGGKDKLFGFFVGEVMKKTKGKANPKKVNEILKIRLENCKQKG